MRSIEIKQTRTVFSSRIALQNTRKYKQINSLSKQMVS